MESHFTGMVRQWWTKEWNINSIVHMGQWTTHNVTSISCSYETLNSYACNITSTGCSWENDELHTVLHFT